jgi:DNA-binding IclR family transcriptional regulator
MTREESTPLDRGGVQAIDRAVDILYAVSDGAATVSDVARGTGLSKATTSRLLAALAHRDLVLRTTPGPRYSLGPGLIRLLQQADQAFGALVGVARNSLPDLSDVTNETVTLHVRVGLERICLAQVESPLPLRYTAPIGSRTPIHVGSAGKVLLAFMPKQDRAATLGSIRFDAMTDRTIVDIATLSRELDRTRRQGWASSRGERIEGAIAVSVPVFGPQQVVFALSILAPEYRANRKKMEAFVPALQDVAQGIAQRLSSVNGKEA